MLDGQLLQRLDNRRHARAERALDHDDVAGADGGQHLRFERGGVFGLENVYVGDASIMPSIPRANTNLTTAAIAERIAELLA